MFPSNDVFPNFGGIGVSMFFVTYVGNHLCVGDSLYSQKLHDFAGLSFHNLCTHLAVVGSRVQTGA